MPSFPSAFAAPAPLPSFLRLRAAAANTQHARAVCEQQLPVLAVGGVDENNVGTWWAAGAKGFGIALISCREMICGK